MNHPDPDTTFEADLERLGATLRTEAVRHPGDLPTLLHRAHQRRVRSRTMMATVGVVSILGLAAAGTLHARTERTHVQTGGNRPSTNQTPPDTYVPPPGPPCPGEDPAAAKKSDQYRITPRLWVTDRPRHNVGTVCRAAALGPSLGQPTLGPNADLGAEVFDPTTNSVVGHYNRAFGFLSPADADHIRSGKAPGQEIRVTVKGTGCPPGRLGSVSIHGGWGFSGGWWAGASSNGTDVTTTGRSWIGGVSVTYSIGGHEYTKFAWIPLFNKSNAANIVTLTCGRDQTEMAVVN